MTACYIPPLADPEIETWIGCPDWTHEPIQKITEIDWEKQVAEIPALLDLQDFLLNLKQ